MTRNGYTYTAVIALFLCLMLAAYLNGKRKGYEIARETILRRTDTIVRTDTLIYEKPVPVYSRIIDTMFVPYAVTETDTIVIELPREQKVYRDSSYTAYVSGYRPALDSLSIVQRSITIEHTITEMKNPAISIGIQSGYGMTPKGMQPYIGVGVQWNIINFPRRP